MVDSETGKVVSGPKVYLNAVAEDESEFKSINAQVVDQLEDAMANGTTGTYQLQQLMRRTLGGWISRKLHRRPMIVPVVADVATDVEKQD